MCGSRQGKCRRRTKSQEQAVSLKGLFVIQCVSNLGINVLRVGSDGNKA